MAKWSAGGREVAMTFIWLRSGNVISCLTGWLILLRRYVGGNLLHLLVGMEWHPLLNKGHTICGNFPRLLKEATRFPYRPPLTCATTDCYSRRMSAGAASQNREEDTFIPLVE
jgi:hypothetical protein